jgi:uncharacterized protein (DUF427 family)
LEGESTEREDTMSEKTVLQPGPDHPITITPNGNRVVVTVAGKVVADTRKALTLQESTYPPIEYIPLADVDQSLLERTATETYCPYKGDASYYSIPLGGSKATDAVWEYQAPHGPVEQIKDHVAFYPDRVDAIDIEADGARS